MKAVNTNSALWVMTVMTGFGILGGTAFFYLNGEYDPVTGYFERDPSDFLSVWGLSVVMGVAIIGILEFVGRRDK